MVASLLESLQGINVHVFEYVLNGTSPCRNRGDNCANEDVPSKVFVTDHLAAAEVFDSEA